MELKFHGGGGQLGKNYFKKAFVREEIKKRKRLRKTCCKPPLPYAACYRCNSDTEVGLEGTFFSGTGKPFSIWLAITSTQKREIF